MSTGFGGVKDPPPGQADLVDLTVPDTFGANYRITRGLRPLADRNLASRVSLVSNLKLPSQQAPGAAIPPGGRVVEWHNSTLAPLVTGVRSKDSDGGFTGCAACARATVHGATSDALVADFFAANGQQDAIRNLCVRSQVGYYAGNPDAESTKRNLRMSYRQNPSTGALEALEPLVDPQSIFDTLFPGGAAPTDPEGAAVRQFALRKGLSVLDLVRKQTDRLLPRVSASDRHRLDQHFSQIRDLEVRLGSVSFQEGTCAIPERPARSQSAGADWAGETDRSSAIAELTALAMACGLTHTVSWMITAAKSYMSAEHITGDKLDVHDLGHQNSTMEFLEKKTDVVAWHVDQFCKLVSALEGTPHGAGSLLDHAAMTLVFEGGGGLDPATNRKLGPHSSDNMFALSAGGAGGLSQGQHIDGKGAHPSSVIVSAMEAAGVGGGLGEIRNGIEGLL